MTQFPKWTDHVQSDKLFKWLGDDSFKIKGKKMIQFPVWTDHVQSDKLFKWKDDGSFKVNHMVSRQSSVYNSNTNADLSIPHHILMSDVENVPRNFKETPRYDRQRVSYISMDWVRPQETNLEFHPSLIVMNNVHRYDDLLSGKISDENVEAITIDTLEVLWRTYEQCQNNNIPYRPGPHTITITNYREYWKDGKFLRREWDGLKYDWEAMYLGRLHSFMYITDDAPSWKEHTPFGIADVPQIKIKKLQDLLHSLQKPATPFANEFFNHTTDEFRFMEIVQHTNTE
jgi:hypothetical protein